MPVKSISWILWLTAGVSPLHAQQPGAHATLRWWEDQARLAIFDRNGSYFGRTSERGILQRFNPQMDAEYDIDLISFSFALADEYEWYRRGRGARFWTGSMNHLNLIQNAEFVGPVDLGASWGAQIHFTHQQTLQADRNLVRVSLGRDLLGGRARMFAAGTLKALKPDADVEWGVTWRLGDGQVTTAVAALDAFSDFIYQTLEVSAALSDTVLDYLVHPYSLRFSADVPLGESVRVEAYGLLATKAELTVDPQLTAGTGFRQGERYRYLGGLLEWTPSPRTAIGAIATWVRAETDRAPLALGSAADAFRLTEETRQLGGYLIHWLTSRLGVESWVNRLTRPEDRVFPDSTVRYEDQAWIGRTALLYRARESFRGELSLDYVAREVTRPGPVPSLGSLGDNNYRLRVDFGWRFGDRALLMLGTNVDLDKDDGTAIGAFDGGHGRFTIYW